MKPKPIGFCFVFIECAGNEPIFIHENKGSDNDAAPQQS